MHKLELCDDDIGRQIAEFERSGELKLAPSFGKPMQAAQGWDETPAELRMPFKILKDAGVVPPEIALFHERTRLRAALDEATRNGRNDDRLAIQLSLAALEQKLSLRLEALARSGGL